jgi:hypothetical protein
MSERNDRIEPAVPELDESWFDRAARTASSRPPPSIPSSVRSAPRESAPPIGDPLADDWFR